MEQRPSGLIPVGQAARLIGVHVDTLRRWESEGRVSAVRLNNSRGDRRFRRSDLDDVLSGEAPDASSGVWLSSRAARHAGAGPASDVDDEQERGVPA
jgi:excisionase family DNA binding protein